MRSITPPAVGHATTFSGCNDQQRSRNVLGGDHQPNHPSRGSLVGHTHITGNKTNIGYIESTPIAPQGRILHDYIKDEVQTIIKIRTDQVVDRCEAQTR